jgi:lincosamide nucleotidyltransferase A/C/D/E
MYGPPENGQSYPAEALVGKGNLNGRIVACITREWLVKFNTGCQPDENDRADVSARCERFGIPVPREYLQSR